MGQKTGDKSSVEPEEEILNQHDAVLTGLKPFKPRRRRVVHVWPDNVEFDESEEVLTIDGEGNMKKVNDPIQPHDVWFAKGVRYCVTFNEFYQPLKKGGHILVRFIGDVARKERFCPIRETNWHHVNAKYKVDIVKCIREHFVLPDGDAYDEGILKRVGKSVRQYRHYLKKTFFKPTTKNREEIYQAGPSGVPLDSWIHLVDYWYSEKGKEEKNKREPTELEVFKQTHKRKDGSYVKDTLTNEFVLDVDTYIETEVATNPTKPKVQIENEAFGKLMYGEEIPKRPLGYGFGVKGSDVFGLHGILRKEAVNSGDSNSLALQNTEKVQNVEKAIVSLTKDNKELQTKFNETTIILSKILEGMSSGIPPAELSRLAKSALNSQISDSANTFGGASRSKEQFSHSQMNRPLKLVLHSGTVVSKIYPEDTWENCLFTNVKAFKALLSSTASEDQLAALGKLVYQCHYSYNACGPGSVGTDRIVKLVQEMQHAKTPEPEDTALYGAKITGGGSGGTVCTF
ncbi:hypothetical protein RND81_09G124500 [Saponaria officinalis]|uniref:Uncharacterized protein n=1 Tax=Saponaria officinalis TaxID=3572 RepID=A0AAW1ILZ9_SAPOF